MKRFKRVLLYTTAVVAAVPAVYPLFFLFLSSFKTSGEYIRNLWGLPGEFFLGNYQRVFSSRFLIYFKNSVVLSFVTLLILIAVSSLASYVLSRIKFKLAKPLLTFFLMGMMIPVHATLIPVYVLTNRLGLYNNIWGLVGPYVAINIPISVFIMTTFFKTVYREIEESAFMDGCSHFQIYLRILLPISTPAIATVAIFNFLNIWNEFIYALVLINSASSMTLPLGLREFYGREAVNVPGILTAVFMSTLPMILFFVFAQEKVIKSMVAGSVKG